MTLYFAYDSIGAGERRREEERSVPLGRYADTACT